MNTSTEKLKRKVGIHCKTCPDNINALKQALSVFEKPPIDVTPQLSSIPPRLGGVHRQELEIITDQFVHFLLSSNFHCTHHGYRDHH